jgi:hypothetical protein
MLVSRFRSDLKDIIISHKKLTNLANSIGDFLTKLEFVFSLMVDLYEFTTDISAKNQSVKQPNGLAAIF